MRAALSLSVIALLSLAPPATAQERQWTLQTTDEDAYLMFGVPDTDDVGLSLWCQMGSDQVRIFLPITGKARPGQRLPLKLTVSSKTYRLKVRATTDQATGKLNAEASLGPIRTIPRALAAASGFSVRLNGHDAAYPLGEADVAGLIEVCRKR